MVCEYQEGKCKNDVPKLGAEGSIEVQKFVGKN